MSSPVGDKQSTPQLKSFRAEAYKPWHVHLL